MSSRRDASVRAPDQTLAPDDASWRALALQTAQAVDRCAGALRALTAEHEPAAAARTGAAELESCLLALQRLAARLDDDLRARHGIRLELDAVRGELAESRDDLERTRDSESRARHLSLHDALTGLPNRHSFEQCAALALDGLDTTDARPFALLYIDLDGFKRVNDAHGHAVGDELLRIIGARLAHAVRAGDVVCRYGGDEFIALLPGVAGDAPAAVIAGKLAEIVSAPCAIGALELRVHASIGISIYPRDGTTLEALLDRADGAMFRAKRVAQALA